MRSLLPQFDFPVFGLYLLLLFIFSITCSIAFCLYWGINFICSRIFLIFSSRFLNSINKFFLFTFLSKSDLYLISSIAFPFASNVSFNSCDFFKSLNEFAHFICSSMKLYFLGGTFFPSSFAFQFSGGHTALCLLSIFSLFFNHIDS